jgi:asparagine synthase (glutamine-hydrolysing)
MMMDRLEVRRGQRLARLMRGRGLTYLSDRKLAVILEECRASRNRGSGGIFIEAGCALGGSTVVIADQRPASAPFMVFDTFEGMPPPTERDSPDVHERYRTIASGKSVGIDGQKYYGYRTDLEAHVRRTLEQHVRRGKRNGIQLVKGLVQDTLIGDQPVAFAHIDVDWFEPVLTCAERIFPRLEIGACMIFDDYSDYQSCRNAVDSFFASRMQQVQIDTAAGSCRVRRIAADRAS